MNMEHAERKRDLRLRRRLLMLMHAARVRPESGWMSGRFICDVIDATFVSGHRFVDDAHAMGLLRDLISGGYAEERDDRLRSYQPPTLEFTSYRISHRGVALVEQQIDPDPLVDDDRVKRPGRVV